MKRRYVLTLVGLAAAAAAAAFVLVFEMPEREAEAEDPRTAPPLVSVAEAKKPEAAERSFTGTVASRIQSNLGFRIPGKIVQRLVDAGQQVKKGQALMRIDETDLQLALTAKRNTVIAARAVLIQAEADEKRYAELVKNRLAATPQRYEQAKTALDTAAAQLAAAEADARVAENAANYAVLPRLGRNCRRYPWRAWTGRGCRPNSCSTRANRAARSGCLAAGVFATRHWLRSERQRLRKRRSERKSPLATDF